MTRSTYEAIANSLCEFIVYFTCIIMYRVLRFFFFFCNVHFLCILYSLHSYTCTDNHVELLLWQDQACTHTHIKKIILSWCSCRFSHEKLVSLLFHDWCCTKAKINLSASGSQQTDYTKHYYKIFFMQLEEAMNWFLGSHTHGYFYSPLSWPRNQSCMKP